MPLTARGARRVETAVKRSLERRGQHGQTPAAIRGDRLGAGWEAKYERKGEWRSHDPDTVGTVLHGGIDRFEAIGHDTTAAVETAAFLPALAAIIVDAIASIVSVSATAK
jgi:hypothetical protein